MFNAQQMLTQLLSANPHVRRNKNAMSMLNVIMNNDAKQGEEIAMNILNSYGVSKEEGIEMAKQRFGL